MSLEIYIDAKPDENGDYVHSIRAIVFSHMKNIKFTGNWILQKYSDEKHDYEIIFEFQCDETLYVNQDPEIKKRFFGPSKVIQKPSLPKTVTTLKTISARNITYRITYKNEHARGEQDD